jgi:hypothetical protein
MSYFAGRLGDNGQGWMLVEGVKGNSRPAGKRRASKAATPGSGLGIDDAGQSSDDLKFGMMIGVDHRLFIFKASLTAGSGVIAPNCGFAEFDD